LRPVLTVARLQEFAAAWGSRLELIGAAGHINGASGHGPWPEGEQMLIAFRDSLG
jgi:predicted alpha/beta hydrolase family esterase